MILHQLAYNSNNYVKLFFTLAQIVNIIEKIYKKQYKLIVFAISLVFLHLAGDMYKNNIRIEDKYALFSCCFIPR
jgi:hypothetical protein